MLRATSNSSDTGFNATTAPYMPTVPQVISASEERARKQA